MAQIPRKRDARKFATTNITNELVDAIQANSLGVLGLVENRRTSSPASLIPVIIGTATQDGTNKRWSYAFVEAEKTAAAYAGWSTKSGGITGTAYNSAEYINGATGAFGNGVSSTNLTGTITIQHVTAGIIVWVHAVTLTTGATEYWFTFANGVDGACS